MTTYEYKVVYTLVEVNELGKLGFRIITHPKDMYGLFFMEKVSVLNTRINGEEVYRPFKPLDQLVGDVDNPATASGLVGPNAGVIVGRANQTVSSVKSNKDDTNT